MQSPSIVMDLSSHTKMTKERKLKVDSSSQTEMTKVNQCVEEDVHFHLCAVKFECNIELNGGNKKSSSFILLDKVANYCCYLDRRCRFIFYSQIVEVHWNTYEVRSNELRQHFILIWTVLYYHDRFWVKIYFFSPKFRFLIQIQKTTSPESPTAFCHSCGRGSQSQLVKMLFSFTFCVKFLFQFSISFTTLFFNFCMKC